MRTRTGPKLAKWPFVFADAALLGVAWLIFWQSRAPMTVWDAFFCAACVALGALLCVTPFLCEYRAAMKLTEADRLTNAVLQLENIEIIGRQITNATANWQTAHEHATKTVEASREIAEGIATEARTFTEFMKKANDAEKNHLRLEVDKLRRAENEWLQILVRILDHIFALYQAAARSGQGNLLEQLGRFQNACRDVARRVGLVPFVAIPGEAFDTKVHQLAEADSAPAAEARIADTLATGYSFQGQLVRPALVILQRNESPDQPAAASSPSDRAGEREQSTATVEGESVPQPQKTPAASESPAELSTEPGPTSSDSVGPTQDSLPKGPPDSEREEIQF